MVKAVNQWTSISMPREIRDQILLLYKQPQKSWTDCLEDMVRDLLIYRKAIKIDPSLPSEVLAHH